MSLFSRVSMAFSLVLLLPGGTATADLSSDAETLFDWAEENYPQYFSPAGETTRYQDPWLYRYYPATDTYAGVSTGEEVWVSGDLFGGAVYINTVTDLLAVVDPQAAAIPDILGAYYGSLPTTATQCTGEPDDSFTLSGNIAVTSQSGESFQATGAFSISRYGIMFYSDMEFTGWVTVDGALGGTYSQSFAGDNGFTSQGSGTFSGSVSGNTLSMQISGLDTDISGVTCTITAQFNGTR